MIGIVGFMGLGRIEMVKIIFGEFKKILGSILIEGKILEINNFRDVMNNGICYVLEDRKSEGCIFGMLVGDNMILCNLSLYERKNKFLDKKKEVNDINEYIKKINIKIFSKD